MFFRKVSETWVAKLLLALVALSMAGLFGLGQMTSYWGIDTHAMRVGNMTVKPQELLRDVDKKAKQMSALTGQYISIQQALAQGILTEVIASKVNTFLARIAAQELDLAASSNAVGNYIVNNPAFQTNTGTYDPAVMRLYLTQMQMSEPEFIVALREQLAIQHLTGAIESVMAVPEKMQDILYAYQQETRDFEAILLPSSSVKITEKPSKEELKTYYDAMTDTLYTPEYRQILTLRITPEMLAKTIPVSDEEVKAVYQERQDVYSTPEKRRVEQILLQDKEQAQKLYEELNADNFEALAKEKANQDKQAIDLGWIEKSSVVEQIGDAAFNAPVGKVLPPIESQFGYHILVVREIEKAKQTPLKDVQDEIKSTLQAQRAYDLLSQKSRILDDALGAGQHLADAAKLVSLDTDKAITIDATGTDESGKLQNDLPAELVQKMFRVRTGDSSPLYPYQGGFIVAELMDIKPSVLKTYEQSKDLLVAEWTKDRQHKNAADFAQKILTEAQKAKTLSAIAKKHDLKTQDLKDVRRQDITEILPNEADTLFKTNENDIRLIGVNETDYIIVKTTKVNAADQEDTVMKNLFTNALSQQMAESLYQQILAYYEQSNKIEINQPLIKEFFEPLMNSAD